MTDRAVGAEDMGAVAEQAVRPAHRQAGADDGHLVLAREQAVQPVDIVEARLQAVELALQI